MGDSLEFQGLSSDVHHCTSFRSGDWIVWKCPICTDYERKYNWKTREMSCVGKTEHLHTGSNDGGQNLNALLKNGKDN